MKKNLNKELTQPIVDRVFASKKRTRYGIRNDIQNSQ